MDSKSNLTIDGPGKLTVTSKSFTEGVILGKITATYLAAAGADVTDLTGEKLRGTRAAELQARLLAAARGNSAAVAACSGGQCFGGVYGVHNDSFSIGSLYVRRLYARTLIFDDADGAPR